MNRSTNLLYKKNTRLYISDSFTPQPYSNFSNSMKPIPQHYSLQDNYDPVKHMVDTSSNMPNARRNTTQSTGSYHSFRPADDYNSQCPATTNYVPFFPNSILASNQPKPLINHDLSMKLKATEVQSMSQYGKKGGFNQIMDTNTHHNLNEVYQKSHFQNFNHFLPQSQNQPLSFGDQRSSDSKTSTPLRFDFNSNQGLIQDVSPHGHPTIHQQTMSPFEAELRNKQTQKSLQALKKSSFDQSSILSTAPSSVRNLDEDKVSQRLRKQSQGNQFSSKVDELLEMIEKHEMNPISLLNEVSGKLKKKFDYKTSENFSGRNKIFECICLLDNQEIGTKTGTSKQIAKAEAAKESIKSILLDEKYVTEGAAVILSIQKAAEKALKHEKADRNSLTHSDDARTADSESVSLSSHEHEKAEGLPVCESLLSQPSSATFPKKESGNTKSALYELHSFAVKLNIEPLWSFPLETNEEGEYEVGLQFGNLVVKENGKKKQEAKKEAATKMVNLIKEHQKKDQPIEAVTENLISGKNDALFPQKREDRSRRLFERSLTKTNLLSKIQHSEEVNELNTQENQEFEMLMSSIYNKQRLDVAMTENLQVFFKKITDYSSMITSNPKQIMLDAKEHLADYIRECYLTPIGSFALGSMTGGDIIINALLVYQEASPISSQELLELYQHSLETCYCLDQQSGTNTINMNFEFKIQRDSQGDFIEVIETRKSEGNFRLHIHLGNSLSIIRQNFAIRHVEKIYSVLETSSEGFTEFRRLVSVLKVWKRQAGLDLVQEEILDVALLHVMLNMKQAKSYEKMLNLFGILSSETVTRTVLREFGQDYENLYTSLSDEIRRDLISKCQKSIENVLRGNMSEVKMF